MPLVSNPQLGNMYKAVCKDGQATPKEILFKFVNIGTSGRYEIEVGGQLKMVDHFCDMCSPWTCEIHSV